MYSEFIMRVFNLLERGGGGWKLWYLGVGMKYIHKPLNKFKEFTYNYPYLDGRADRQTLLVKE